jgi:cell division protein FtsB
MFSFRKKLKKAEADNDRLVSEVEELKAEIERLKKLIGEKAAQ